MSRRPSALLLQIALVAALCMTGWFLASTAAQNLRALGVASGFDFLHRESGFIIGETSLLSHHAADTYLRALVVGLLNTFRVALLAIILSTVIGTLVGLARLSPNWLLAKLAAGYVEIFRNTPLIVQLFFWYAALTENLPPPSAAWVPAPGVFVSNRGVAFPFPHIPEAGWLFLLPLLAGCIVLLFVRSKLSKTAASAALGAMLVVGAVISLALLEFDYPHLTGFDFAGGGSLSPEFAALFFGLSLYTAAFIAEILRAGILAVERGQIEAGSALGLSQRQVTRFIVVPQALRIIIPPVTSQYLNCIKNSSLAVAIGYPDLVSIANTTINQTGQAIEGFAIIMLVYLTVSLVIAGVMNWYNRRFALRGAKV